jgi:hypothetical protein
MLRKDLKVVKVRSRSQRSVARNAMAQWILDPMILFYIFYGNYMEIWKLHGNYMEIEHSDPLMFGNVWRFRDDLTSNSLFLSYSGGSLGAVDLPNGWKFFLQTVDTNIRN